MDTEAPSKKGIEDSDNLEKSKAAGFTVEQTFDLIRRAFYYGMVFATLCGLGDKLINKQCAGVVSTSRTESGEKL